MDRKITGNQTIRLYPRLRIQGIFPRNSLSLNVMMSRGHPIHFPSRMNFPKTVLHISLVFTRFRLEDGNGNVDSGSGLFWHWWQAGRYATEMIARHHGETWLEKWEIDLLLLLWRSCCDPQGDHNTDEIKNTNGKWIGRITYCYQTIFRLPLKSCSYCTY